MGDVSENDTRERARHDMRECARKFLRSIRAYLRTGDFKIEKRDKNIQFDRKVSVKRDEKKKILLSLQAEDCQKVEANNNPRYPDTEVFVFLKTVVIDVYGKPERHRLYIKMYLNPFGKNVIVDVISFHDNE